MAIQAVASVRPAAMAPSATACALSAAVAAMEESVNPFRAFAMAVQPETSAVFTAAAASAAACALVATVAATAARLKFFSALVMAVHFAASVD